MAGFQHLRVPTTEEAHPVLNQNVPPGARVFQYNCSDFSLVPKARGMRFDEHAYAQAAEEIWFLYLWCAASAHYESKDSKDARPVHMYFEKIPGDSRRLDTLCPDTVTEALFQKYCEIMSDTGDADSKVFQDAKAKTKHAKQIATVDPPTMLKMRDAIKSFGMQKVQRYLSASPPRAFLSAKDRTAHVGKCSDNCIDERAGVRFWMVVSSEGFDAGALLQQQLQKNALAKRALTDQGIASAAAAQPQGTGNKFIGRPSRRPDPTLQAGMTGFNSEPQSTAIETYGTETSTQGEAKHGAPKKRASRAPVGSEQAAAEYLKQRWASMTRASIIRAVELLYNIKIDPNTQPSSAQSPINPINIFNMSRMNETLIDGCMHSLNMSAYYGLTTTPVTSHEELHLNLYQAREAGHFDKPCPKPLFSKEVMFNVYALPDEQITPLGLMGILFPDRLGDRRAQKRMAVSIEDIQRDPVLSGVLQRAFASARLRLMPEPEAIMSAVQAVKRSSIESMKEQTYDIKVIREENRGTYSSICAPFKQSMQIPMKTKDRVLLIDRTYASLMEAKVEGIGRMMDMFSIPGLGSPFKVAMLRHMHQSRTMYTTPFLSDRNLSGADRWWANFYNISERLFGLSLASDLAAITMVTSMNATSSFHAIVHLVASGDHDTSKTYAIMTVLAWLIAGTKQTNNRVSPQANTQGGDWTGGIWNYPEISSQITGGSDNKHQAGTNDTTNLFKGGFMETTEDQEVVVSELRYDENGDRITKTSTRQAANATIASTNLPLMKFDKAIKSRLITVQTDGRELGTSTISKMMRGETADLLKHRNTWQLIIQKKQILQMLLNELIRFGIIPEASTPITDLVIYKLITENEYKIMLPFNIKKRPLKIFLAVVKTLIKMHAIDQQFFSPLSVFRGDYDEFGKHIPETFYVEQLLLLEGRLTDKHLSVITQAFGFCTSLFDPFVSHDAIGGILRGYFPSANPTRLKEFMEVKKGSFDISIKPSANRLTRNTDGSTFQIERTEDDGSGPKDGDGERTERDDGVPVLGEHKKKGEKKGVGAKAKKRKRKMNDVGMGRGHAENSTEYVIGLMQQLSLRPEKLFEESDAEQSGGGPERDGYMKVDDRLQELQNAIPPFSYKFTPEQRSAWARAVRNYNRFRRELKIKLRKLAILALSPHITKENIGGRSQYVSLPCNNIDMSRSAEQADKVLMNDIMNTAKRHMTSMASNDDVTFHISNLKSTMVHDIPFETILGLDKKDDEVDTSARNQKMLIWRHSKFYLHISALIYVLSDDPIKDTLTDILCDCRIMPQMVTVVRSWRSKLEADHAFTPWVVPLASDEEWENEQHDGLRPVKTVPRSYIPFDTIQNVLGMQTGDHVHSTLSDYLHQQNLMDSKLPIEVSAHYARLLECCIPIQAAVQSNVRPAHIEENLCTRFAEDYRECWQKAVDTLTRTKQWEKWQIYAAMQPRPTRAFDAFKHVHGDPVAEQTDREEYDRDRKAPDMLHAEMGQEGERKDRHKRAAISYADIYVSENSLQLMIDGDIYFGKDAEELPEEAGVEGMQYGEGEEEDDGRREGERREGEDSDGAFVQTDPDGEPPSEDTHMPLSTSIGNLGDNNSCGSIEL